MVNYKIFSSVVGILIVLILIILTRRAKLHTAHLFWWFFIIICILILSFFPTIVDKIGLIFGIGYPPIIVCILGLGAILIKILTMDIYITQNEIRYKKLAQKLAILEKELKNYNSKKGILNNDSKNFNK